MPRYDVTFSTPEVAEEARELLRGAVDLHVHPGPSPFPRRIGILEAAEQAADLGFRAIVVKSHHHSMVTDVAAVRDSVGALPLPVFAGVALNDQVGGLNPWAVELALQMGGRIVWFPTISSRAHICAHSGEHETSFPTATMALRPNRELSILDDAGQVPTEVKDILEVVRDHGAVLTGGHLGVEQADRLFETAQEVGVEKILLNHPNFIVGAEADLCARWSRRGIYVEHSLCMYDEASSFHQWDIDVLVDYIRAVGVEHTVLSSDLGQTNQPLPVESYGRIVVRLGKEGFSDDELRRMVGGNAADLLGL